MPVYDCTETDFIASGTFPPIKAPRYYDEVPLGSAVVVAHTVHKYGSKDKQESPVVNLSLNLLWIAILKM